MFTPWNPNLFHWGAMPHVYPAYPARPVAPADRTGVESSSSLFHRGEMLLIFYFTGADFTGVLTS